jgi:hypothetical protein
MASPFVLSEQYSGLDEFCYFPLSLIEFLSPNDATEVRTCQIFIIIKYTILIIFFFFSSNVTKCKENRRPASARAKCLLFPE